MLTTLVSLWVVAAVPAKLPAPVAKEMTELILAVDKALGLESWPSHGAKPCVDRGGPENPTKDVSLEDTKRCAEGAIGKEFLGLGKSYVVAVLMAPMGPTTVMAFGIADAEGWAAYSCDPDRKCPPTKMSPTTKWGKRLITRQAKACGDDQTIWFPAGQRACPSGEANK